MAPILRGQHENRLTAAIRREGFPLYRITEARRFDPAVIRQLRNTVSAVRPSILWTNHPKSHFLARALNLNRQARWIAMHHGYTATSPLMRAYNQLDRWSLRAADRVVTVCRYFAAELEHRGVDASRVRVLRVPVRSQGHIDRSLAAASRVRLGIAPETRVILTVGRLSAEKGHAHLLHALKLLPPGSARLIVVGAGPELSALKSLRARLGLGQTVDFAGFQPDLRPYYSAADVFALSSHSEGSPNVLFEAMDAGVPVVATAVGGLPEYITSGVNALLVPDRNPAALAAALAQVLNNPALGNRLIAGGDELVRGNSPARYFENLLRIFLE
jgi:glycosyltransferase involved in cell wall biosynthesis